MKKFAIVSKNDEVSVKVATKIQKKLVEAGLIYSDNEPDLVCTVGGDGTFLSAIHKYIALTDKVVFTGVHTGTLGFFADYTLANLDDCIKDIIEKEPEVENKTLLKIRLLKSNKCYYAVNEARIESSKTQNIKVSLNNLPLETYHGCGLCISTQVGSTAFNRSAGGAVIHPSLDVMQLCEIVGIHHKYYQSLGNPLIMAKNTVVKLALDNYFDATLCFDRYSISIPKDEEVEIQLSDKSVKLAHYNPFNWVEHLEQLF